MASFKEIVGKEKPVLIDFYATWCGPCKMVTPMLDDLKQRVKNKATIIKIDIDKNQELAAKLKVQGVPTFMLYKNGELLWRASGVQPISVLEDLLNENA